MSSTPPPLYTAPKPAKKRTALIVTLIVLGLCVLIAIVSIIWSNTPQGQAAGTQTSQADIERPTETQKPTKTQKPTETSKPTKTPRINYTPTTTTTPDKEISGITFQELVEKSRAMTQAQWKEYTREVGGTRIRWTGSVQDVTERKLFGDTWYQVDVCITSIPCTQDAVFIYPREESLQLIKGQSITFQGDLDLSGVDDKDMLFFRVIAHLENPLILP